MRHPSSRPPAYGCGQLPQCAGARAGGGANARSGGKGLPGVGASQLEALAEEESVTNWLPRALQPLSVRNGGDGFGCLRGDAGKGEKNTSEKRA